ncbi:MAG TPA: aconitate hydratase AcnA [bacterium]|nr:aconitate hydratase AcnA [bacterium]
MSRYGKAIRSTIRAGGAAAGYYPLAALGDRIAVGLERLPFTVKVLLENVVRHAGRAPFTDADVATVAAWRPGEPSGGEFPFLPARVLLQDFTGVPVVVDLAAMRDAVEHLGGDPRRVNPTVPADLVIDHSVQVDVYGTAAAFERNVAFEYARNRERYLLLRWAQRAFDNLRVVPPGTGIVHQVNLEYLARVVDTRPGPDGTPDAVPDTLVGTDSHTTMINGLGVLGWGVGGIEAEAVLLGQPMYLTRPEVIGLRLVGELAGGVTATDLVLTVTQLLRKVGVVGKFVECFGPSLGALTLPDRATIANMSPEFGATATMFPIDDETLAYLRLTGRPEERIALVEAYARAQGMFCTAAGPEPLYDKVVELDLGTVEPSLAGPRRPQDRVPLAGVGPNFRAAYTERMAAAAPGGPAAGVAVAERPPAAQVRSGDRAGELAHGSVVIAAITSCTNTSNPEVMIAAGLVAKRAVERGLTVPPTVKTSLAPGSAVVTAYLERSGLTRYLEALGFHTVGYGCTTCIGNSGPLRQPVADAIQAHDLVTVAVLSGNRNFEGRIHPLVRASYLASPPLVVAYALAGTVNLDLTKDPIGSDGKGRPVYLRDIWPRDEEIRALIRSAVSPQLFAERYRDVFHGDETWRALPVPESEVYRWDPGSTYVQHPPFFEGLTAAPPAMRDVAGARVLAWLGESVTTDHISPAGAIPRDGPAGRYLIEHGVQPVDFNTYGARRGNHEVLMRGTFANVRLRNRLAGGREGGWTTHVPSGELLPIYDAAVRYQAEGTPLIVLAGAEYGSGSSRDWAAKGPMLLGVRAVIAQSFERIHRSNLIGMGILPLEFRTGESPETHGLDGTEAYDIGGIAGGLRPGQALTVRARRGDGTARTFDVTVRLDTPIDVEYYRHGGILPYVVRRLLR